MSKETGYRTFEVRAEGDATPRGILTTEQAVPMFDFDRGDYVPEVLLMSGMKKRGDSIKLLDTHRGDSVRHVLGSFRNLATHGAGERGVPHRFADGEIDISSTEQEVATKVREGHINEMSVGYRYSADKTIHIPAGKRETIEGTEYAGPVNIRTEWEAQEASLVPLGADDLAQIRGFKSLEDARKQISNQKRNDQSDGDGLTPAPAAGDDKPGAEVAERTEKTTKTTTNPTNIRTMSTETESRSISGTAEVDVQKLIAEAEAKGAERARTNDNAIRAVLAGANDAAWALQQSPDTIEDAYKAVNAKLRADMTNVGQFDTAPEEVGMSKKEKKRYSLRSAMLDLAHGRKVGGLENEVSETIAQRCGREPQGFFMAPEILFSGARGQGTRANQTAASATLGDDIVENDLRAGDFIDVLRPNMLTLQLGIRMLTGLVGDAIIPRKTAGTVGSWFDEVTTAFTEDNIEFDTITLTPNHLGVTTPVSKQLLAQSTPDIDMLLRDDFTQAIAVALDQAIYRGSGTNQPQGIDAATSVPTVTITTAGQPDLAELVEFESDIDAGNALAGQLAWVTTPAVRGWLRQTLLTSGVSGYMWNSDNTILGYPAYSTTNADTNDIFFGRWGDYIMGTWDGVDLIVDPYTSATTRLIKYTIGMMADGDVRRPASFCTNA